jgi:hypothetical protein
MAKLRVTPALLAELLLPGAKVTITGAGYEFFDNLVVLNVLGDDVPDAEEVTATCFVTLGEPEPKRIVTTKIEARS